jgi:hypothetical protein
LGVVLIEINEDIDNDLLGNKFSDGEMERDHELNNSRDEADIDPT